MYSCVPLKLRHFMYEPRIFSVMLFVTSVITNVKMSLAFKCACMYSWGLYTRKIASVLLLTTVSWFSERQMALILWSTSSMHRVRKLHVLGTPYRLGIYDIQSEPIRQARGGNPGEGSWPEYDLVRVCSDLPLKCHIPSFETVVG